VPRRLLKLMIFAISISAFTAEVKAIRKNFNQLEYIELLKEEQVYTSKRKHILIELNKEYIKKHNYYCKLSENNRCDLYSEKINTIQEVFEMLTDHQEDIMTEIDEQF
jgi:hypothetical protein